MYVDSTKSLSQGSQRASWKRHSVTVKLPNSASLYRHSRQKLDMRLSGAAVIDETLHVMIDFVLRDYIHSWYDFVSDDDEFIHQLRKALQEILVNLSSR